MSKYTPKVYTISISRDLKNQKVAIHPPPTTDHPPSTKIKKKVSALKSKILIKYKRIKWTPSCKATLLLPGGKHCSNQYQKQKKKNGGSKSAINHHYSPLQK